MTVLRDGAVRGSHLVSDVSDDQLLELIVGRAVTTEFPGKAGPAGERAPSLSVDRLSGRAFHEISMTASPGEIVGLAGIVGNGQSEFLRALAGIGRASGRVELNGTALRTGRPSAALRAGVVYLSPDRLNEGLFGSLSVRENTVVSSLGQFATAGVVGRRAEVRAAAAQRDALAIKAPSIDANVLTLSGGNQQKVLLARALVNDEARLLLADEPTQGVDVGARAEIYRILREAADSGAAVIIVSSDSRELEGLCDRVLVFSSGHVVAELHGDEVREDAIAHAMLTSTRRRGGGDGGQTAGPPGPLRQPGRRRRERRERRAGLAGPGRPRRLRGLRRAGDRDPRAEPVHPGPERALPVRVQPEHADRADRRLAFIAFGQACVILTGGIDLSVGPLAGLVVVIGSFFENSGKAPLLMVLGFVVMIAVSVVVGLLNGAMVQFARFTPIVATLVTYIAIQGVSLVLRPFQGGYISFPLIDGISHSEGGIAIAFLLAIVAAAGMERALRTARWGRSLRAVGSEPAAAFRLGVRPNVSVIGAYVLSSLFACVGGVLLMAQVGVGDPTQGVTYTLGSVTAVVLGGTSIFGGRGSFIGVLLGAVLVEELLNVTIFLQLSQAWQYWFEGVLVMVAVGIYTQARARPGAALTQLAGEKADKRTKGGDMRALVFTAPGQAAVTQADRPQAGPGEVVVRSRVVGVCHSDLELLAGRYIIPISYPVIPGHEWSGEIAEVGPGVEGLAEGDLVVGECVVGPGGRDHFGFSISGAAAEYFMARAEWLHKLPGHMSFGAGALVEPFSVAYDAVRAGVVDPSDRVAVLGGGPIGLLSAMAAVGRNADVVLIEPRPDRRALGEKLGVRQALDPAAGDLRERPWRPPAARCSTSSSSRPGTRPRWRRRSPSPAITAGSSTSASTSARGSRPSSGLIQARSLRIQGIVGSAGVWPQAIRFLASGVVDPTPIVTASFPLADAVGALEAASLGSGNIKVHIETSA